MEIYFRFSISDLVKVKNKKFAVVIHRLTFNGILKKRNSIIKSIIDKWSTMITIKKKKIPMQVH